MVFILHTKVNYFIKYMCLLIQMYILLTAFTAVSKGLKGFYFISFKKDSIKYTLFGYT